MAVPTNTTLSTDMTIALDQEFTRNYEQDYNQLADVLGLVSPEVVAAGTTLYYTTVEGSLSTDAYTEGDEVPISKYTLSKHAVDSVTIDPYRKRTTAQAVLKTGVERAVIRTDRKMLADVRDKNVTTFVGALSNGTGTATGTTLQAALANSEGVLADTMETNHDGAPSNVIHVVNRMDVAGYLGTHEVTTQTLFGMTYLESFLGVDNILLTNKVASGTIYTLPTDDIHTYVPDFSAISQAGLTYTISDSGLIGVAHTPDYDYLSVNTHVLTGLLIWPENATYIVKGTIAAAA